MKRITAALMAALGLTLALPAFSQDPDWGKVLSRIDELGDFENSDFSAEITVVSKKPGEEDSTIVARYFRRDSKEEFTIVILEPTIQKGQGYFSSGDDLWFYDPESRKFAYSSLKDSFQDSDAQNSDFSSSSLAEDYEVTASETVKLGAAETWALTLTAKDRTVPVSKRKLWIRTDNYLVLKEEHYSVSDRLMRTLAYPKYQTVEGKYVPQAILIVDNLKQGEKTQITFKAPSVSRLPDSVFNKEYLQKVNQ